MKFCAFGFAGPKNSFSTLCLCLIAGFYSIFASSDNSVDAATQIPPEAQTEIIAGLEQRGIRQIKWPRAESPIKPDPEMEKVIADLVSNMTLKEKVGQMLQAEIKNISPDEIKKYHIGSVLSGGGSYPKEKGDSVIDWVAAADRFYQGSIENPKKRAAIPIVWGIDAVHGHNNVRGATIFPHNIGLGAARNPQLIKLIGEVTAREVAVTGIRWTFAPTVAVARDERWGRTYESYSEDPELVKDYALAMVVGLQGNPMGDDFFAADKVIATAKHFVGDGGTYRGKDQGDTRLSEKELFEIHAQGYYTAIAAGVQTIMASFNSWNAYKLHGSHYMLTEVLKEQMGFDGFVVGDWNGHGQIPGCSDGSCAQAFNAGVDMMMVPVDWRDLHRNTLRQVKKGQISEERVNDAVTRILRVKMRAGIIGPNGEVDTLRPAKQKYAGQSAILGHPKHRAVAEQAVRESLVLLKNDDNVLPIQPNQKVFVTGSHANNIANQSGGWSVTWQGTENTNADFPGATSVFAGFEKVTGQFQQSIELGSNHNYKDRPDVAVVVFGENPYAEFEGDQKDLSYSGEKENLKIIQKLKDQGIKVVSVFMSGRPMAVNSLINVSDAFVAAWLPGSEGQGVAQVLSADQNGKSLYDFKGKLSFSWPRNADQVPMNIGDDDYDPLYPYGFGLTYK